MKTYTLLLSCLLFSFSTLFTQVPFQGIVTTNTMPIKKAHLQDNIQVLYHTSFNGNLKVFVNDELILNKDVEKGEKETLSLGGNIFNSPNAIMKIVLDDLFYLDQVLHFHHPYIRINYQKEDRQLAIHYEDTLPKEPDLRRDLLKEQVVLAIRQHLNNR